MTRSRSSDNNGSLIEVNESWLARCSCRIRPLRSRAGRRQLPGAAARAAETATAPRRST
jgi:hypothetical protein